jgi:hypothetical protein
MRGSLRYGRWKASTWVRSDCVRISIMIPLRCDLSSLPDKNRAFFVLELVRRCRRTNQRLRRPLIHQLIDLLFACQRPCPSGPSQRTSSVSLTFFCVL